MAAPFSWRLPAAALLVVGLAPVNAADAPAVGDLWEVTSQVSMMGMQMPPQTGKNCSPKTWTRPPTDPNDPMKCTTTNFATSGDTVTWETTCKGPPPVTGTGEVTRQGSDAFTGTINLTSDEISMTIQLSGKRLGACDNPS